LGQLASLNEADDKQAARDDDRAEVRNGIEHTGQNSPHGRVLHADP